MFGSKHSVGNFPHCIVAIKVPQMNQSLIDFSQGFTVQLKNSRLATKFSIQRSDSLNLSQEKCRFQHLETCFYLFRSSAVTATSYC